MLVVLTTTSVGKGESLAERLVENKLAQGVIAAVTELGVRVPIVTQAQLGGPPTVTYVDAFLRLTVVPQITSVYFWKGKVQKENEQLLLIKTTEDKYSELEKFIAESHSYEVPEIVAIRSENVSGPYQAWVEEYLLYKS